MTNNLKKMLIYLATALVVPTVFQVIYQNFIDSAQDIICKILYSAGMFFVCVLVILSVELIRFFFKIRKRTHCKEMMKKIDSIANGVMLPNNESMFDVKEESYALCNTILAQENRLQRVSHDLHHIIYHSTTAKKHLNWIEFIFWNFLRRLHNELGCEIIISLHYDEQARETGLSSHKEQKRYDELFASYSNIAKTLIGNDITVIDEKDFRGNKKHAKFFALDFHDKFVKCILQYVNQLENKELDYKGFMRKISYIESVFPIMAFSNTIWKKSRLYVLDRELAQEVWQQSPFAEFKSTHGIFFITAQTIRDENNKPIRIFSADDTVNINDSAFTITQKLSTTEITTKRTMYKLLLDAFSNGDTLKYKNIADEELDDNIRDLIFNIKSKFNIPE